MNEAESAGTEIRQHESTSRPLHVLMVEDSERDAGLLLRELRRHGYAVHHERVTTQGELDAALSRPGWDLVLADYSLPRFNGLDALKLLQSHGIDIPFILISGTIGEHLAVEAMRAGASDYLLKDQLVRLGAAVERELREAESRRARRRAEQVARVAETETRRLLKSAEQSRLALLSVVEDLKRAEAQTHLQTTALNAAANAIVITDREGKVLWVNPAYTTLTGYTSEEVLGQRDRVLMSDSEDDPLLKELWKTILGGKVWRGELVSRHKQGHRYTEESTITPVRGADGAISHFVVVKQDVTSRKQAVAALRESETRFQQVTAHLGEWVWEMDRDGLYTYASPVVEKILGYRPEEIIGKKYFYDLFPQSDREALKETAQAHFNAMKSFTRFRSYCAHRDGHSVLLETSGTPLVDENGELRGYRGVDSDITERERAEQQIRDQAKLLDLAQDAIAVRDMNGAVAYWNQSCERLTGYSASEAKGAQLKDLLKGAPEVLEQAEKSVGQHGQWNGEMDITTKAGESASVLSRWTLVRDESDKPESVLVISTDITEQKRLKAQFLRAQRLEGVGALASGIAHDLNNILAPILMTASLLRETVQEPDVRAMLDTVQHCAQRGAEIIKQLLTFARGTPGARVPLPVRHLLRDMEKLVRETFPRDIRAKLDVPAAIWPMLGDSTQVHQALMNLCVNARDAMPDGGTLTLMARNVTVDESFAAVTPNAQPGQYVCLSVIDTGTGIQPQDLDRIFDPFFSTKEIGKGTGLGLPTILGIVRGHGGFVRVDSHVGKGTTFELYFPAAEEAREPTDDTLHPPTPLGQGELILVVDDEAAVRKTIRSTLERRGFRVVTATQGAEGVATFSQHRNEIRAVLTDMMMPVMNGPAMVNVLRALKPGLAIVGMTGLPERTGVKGLENLDLSALLTKPFSGEELLRALHTAIGTPATNAAPRENP